MSASHTKHVVLGRLDRAVAEALENFTLPELALDAHTQAVEAFKTALATRQAAALLGPKGVGKTEAIIAVQEEFEAEQLEALALSPEAYQVQRVLYLPRLTAKTVRGCTLAVLRLVSPSTAHDRVRGTRLEDDELMDQLVRELVGDRYVVLIVDELETATPHGVEFVRQLMASAQTVGRTGRSSLPRFTSGERDATDEGGVNDLADDWSAEGNTTGSDELLDDARFSATRRGGRGRSGDRSEARRARLGIVLVGTSDEVKKLTGTGDAQGRWSRFVGVSPMAEVEVAEAYVRVFPRFAAVVREMGRAGWGGFVQELITRGRRLTIRHVANHCAMYFLAMFESRLETMPSDPWTDRTEVPFDREVFLWAFTQADSVPQVAEVKTTRRRRVAR